MKLALSWCLPKIFIVCSIHRPHVKLFCCQPKLHRPLKFPIIIYLWINELGLPCGTNPHGY
ncbi:CLUMA_CG014680, isoform A [Clunio marinus]|uniref:CLUMA_CG014680, isoform A n=1 Tax=Clunio marinus TaxID=568069 RepID=A0A1J1IPB2_9DIPT|nr:CLUMA_CG014680, isoform A [Clunio marinus]